MSGPRSGDDQKPAGSGVWNTPEHLLDEERLPPGATKAAGSGTFSESAPAPAQDQASISDTWRRPSDLQAPQAPEAFTESRITIEQMRTLISASLAPGRQLQFAASSPAFHLSVSEAPVETVFRSFGRALESELSSSASLAGHATQLDVSDPHQATELELRPGRYLFLAVAIVQASASDSGTFIRMVDRKGDHGVLRQFIRSVGGNLRLDRKDSRGMSLSLYLPLAT